jgi:UDP-N-acetylglucosamine 2-epimerase (hydrolysing)
MIGNSSAGIREAPYYNKPSIDIGNRQKNRVNIDTVIHSDNTKESILKAIDKAINLKIETIDISHDFGNGDSNKQFFELLNSDKLWNINQQKQFQDLK